MLDYSISLLEDGSVGDRGFNATDMWNTSKKFRDFLNSKAKIHHNKLHFMYIDWEGHDAYHQERWDTHVNKNVQFFVDESYHLNKKPKNSNFCFTNLFWSFIYPNTIGIRDYYFFHDYLKYKNDYKCKINVPIRRVYHQKLDIIQAVNKLKNPNIQVTQSSFHSTLQYHLAGKGDLPFTLPDENYIEKRGYGIHDWGGEWNDNNMNENMWKMFGISDVVLLFEVSPEATSKKYFEKEKRPPNVTFGDSYITEKSISHILVGKPFIPAYYETIKYYNRILEKYNANIVEYPLKYDFILDILDEIDSITKDETAWLELKDKLTNYVENLRTELIKICSINNSYFDFIISENFEKKTIPTI